MSSPSVYSTSASRRVGTLERVRGGVRVGLRAELKLRLRLRLRVAVRVTVRVRDAL